MSTGYNRKPRAGQHPPKLQLVLAKHQRGRPWAAQAADLPASRAQEAGRPRA